MRQQNIDPSYKAGNNFYFTYAIETTSWYCLPEPGSTVHIYFQNCNEFTGIAVHAMRSGSAAESGCVSAKGAIEDKSFSTEDGKVNCTPCQGQIFYFVAGNMRSASLSFTIPFSGYIPVVIYL